MMDIDFRFTACLHIYTGQNPWHFVTLPSDIAAQIRSIQGQKRGHDIIKITAKAGKSQWQTALFPDKKSHSYLLPIKATIRKTENLVAGEEIALEICFQPDFL